MSASVGVLAAFLIIGMIFGLGFLPTIVAVNRKHNNTLAIFFMNLVLGWTFFGWIGALIWACTDNRRVS